MGTLVINYYVGINISKHEVNPIKPIIQFNQYYNLIGNIVLSSD